MSAVKVTKEEFLYKYFEFYNINASEDKQLSDRQITSLIALMLFNTQKLPQDFQNPFKGEGRGLIRKMLNMSSANYSLVLKELHTKGFLIKNPNLASTYHLRPHLQDLTNKVFSVSKMKLTVEYEITGQGILYKDEANGPSKDSGDEATHIRRESESSDKSHV